MKELNDRHKDCALAPFCLATDILACEDYKKQSDKIKENENKIKIGYFRINCPFCEEKIVSDVINSIKEVNGQWQCNNGHTFVLKYIETIKSGVVEK